MEKEPKKITKLNFPSIYYRIPKEKDIWILRSESDATVISSLKQIPVASGFIFHPFIIQDSAKPYFIQADRLENISIQDFDEIIPSTGQDWEIKASSTSKDFSKNREEYCRNVSDAVKIIRSGNLKKVVLSRVKKIEINAAKNPLKIFHKLCVRYPNAFVSMVYIPGDVLWITATPELLVSATDDKINTVSLAGTKPVDSKEKWSKKEKEEQQVVTDYVQEILKKNCDDIGISGPDEAIAGNVKHLKTSFSATLNTNLWELVSALHPTPAVCGIPLARAKQFIQQTENYDRKYYTGFLGPCNINGKTSLFVNLRCAELFSNHVNLYIGGGITEGSVPEKEWEETELKSKTLLFAFEDE